MLNLGHIETVCGPKTNKRFNEAKPTHIGTTGGVQFFEHPFKGDESPLIVNHDGKWFITVFWDMPTSGELE